MNIVFFCQSCGARFEVGPNMAGKKGRCTKCRQNLAIPQPDAVASIANQPAAVPPPPKVMPRPATARPENLASRLRTVGTSIGLDPVTLQNLSAAPKGYGAALAALDDAEDSKPYLIANNPLLNEKKESGGTANVVKNRWRKETGSLQKLFRRINETAYLLSIPFIALLLFATAMKNRPLALLAATLIVLLNLGRIVAGIANLTVVPLRSGLNAKKLNKPFRRVIEPILTIGIVFLAFTFIPWLSGESQSADVVSRLTENAKGLKGEMKSKVGTIVDQARSLEVQQLESRARDQFNRQAPGSAPIP